MTDIQQRLSETAKNTLESYDAWVKDKSNEANREALSTAVHELRKVASRVEIDMAVSEKDEKSRQPIPIPPHRSKNAGNETSILPDNGQTTGGNHNKSKKSGGNSGGGRRPRRKSAGGEG